MGNKLSRRHSHKSKVPKTFTDGTYDYFRTRIDYAMLGNVNPYHEVCDRFYLSAGDIMVIKEIYLQNGIELYINQVMKYERLLTFADITIYWRKLQQISENLPPYEQVTKDSLM